MSTKPAAHRMYAYYYLWWSTQHWHDKLGHSYPYGAARLPLPARLDANGCGTTSLFPGNQLTDVPSQLWTQDAASTIARDVASAAAAGLAGFAVNWKGEGTRTQTPRSSSYNRRLEALVRAVRKIRARGVDFSLWLSYKSSASAVGSTAMVNDLTYFSRTYGRDRAIDRSNGGRPTVVLMGSRKYSTAFLAGVTRVMRRKLYLVGDENWSTWSARRAALFDGDSYYWSSQDPYGNPHSFDQLRRLARRVKSGKNPDGRRKTWIAPLAPGFNTQIAGGSTCIPRRAGSTLQRNYRGNKASAPDAWLVISWNEVTEGTYLVPMQRYGSTTLDRLARLIAAS
ncbi:MAG: hypothetical protein ACXV3V_00935 [Actinomycetes bacterium]